MTVVDAALMDVRIDFRAVIRSRQSLQIQGRSGANMLLLMVCMACPGQLLNFQSI